MGGLRAVQSLASEPPHPALSPSGRGFQGSTLGIRVDSGVAEGGSVTPFYDPMIAKVIAHGATRNEALDRLSAALRQTIVAGRRATYRSCGCSPTIRTSAPEARHRAHRPRTRGAGGGGAPVDATAAAAGEALLTAAA